MHPLLRLLRTTNAIPELASNWRSRYFELTYTDRPVGFINKRLEWVVRENPRLFTEKSRGCFALTPGKQGELDALVKQLYEKRVFRGWRGEPYAGRTLDGKPEIFFHVERAAARVFGLLRHSVHVNGFVKQANGKIDYWMGKRAATKSRYPGMLDNVVAGGLPMGLTPLECAVKECWEEASIEETEARKRLKCVGSVTRCCEEEGFLALEEIFIFDLDMQGLTPKPQDGEVESFQIVDVPDMVYNKFEKVKPEILIILVEFMIRQGMVDPNPEPEGFLELVRAMHLPIPQHLFNKSVL